MFNEVLIVGKLMKMPYKIGKRQGLEHFRIVVEVKQLFRNSNGYFESDYIPVILWYGVAQTVLDVSQIGDLISIKGRLCASKSADDQPQMEVVAEKVDYLQKYL